MKLTGKTQIRIGMFNKLIIQVEYSYEDISLFISKLLYGWKDATLEDLQEIGYFKREGVIK